MLLVGPDVRAVLRIVHSFAMLLHMLFLWTRPFRRNGEAFPIIPQLVLLDLGGLVILNN